MLEIELGLILTMAAVALAAGFLDAIAGGGGLITLPALLVAGIEPVAALATNKLQASCASVSATVSFARKGLFPWRSSLPMAGMSFIAGGAGALAAGLLPSGTLEKVIPPLLIAVAVYFALVRTPGNAERAPRCNAWLFGALAVPLIGFYDGLFGPGTGSFFLVAFVVLLGQGLMRALSSSKLMNASCNVGSLLVFSMTGKIVWPLALAMAIGALIGAQLGARCAMRFGPGLVRPLLVTVCVAMAAKLLFFATPPPATLPPLTDSNRVSITALSS
ncbi:hypothetical protein PMM47T1_24760 [Pseudomonas sp. M47T1]|uniref:TSUP family transporter n=1 Tax=Pseudomonas sp. M47T1 TaxID=1179778 RepID=UPI0002607E36|nr:TSUP family transporter [Pseudomonas sp. M47T1]EIK93846.1 hypothetical protein PMM47T1_24760 [Pseudomonas sp. M47T1]